MGPSRLYALHLCLMAGTLLLLLCEVMVSQHCHSIINLVDGFNTLFVLAHMALSLPLSARGGRCAGDASAASSHHSAPASPPSAPKKVDPSFSPSTEPLTKRPTHVLIQPPFSLSLLSSPPSPSPRTLHTPTCGLLYGQVRIQVVGAFLAALVLASLCISVSMEVFSHILQPRPVRQPYLVVVVGALSLLHNLAVLGLRRGGMPCVSPGLVWEGETTPRPRNVKAIEQTKHEAKQGCVVDEASDLPSAVDSTYQGGTLILCNEGASSVLETASDSKARDQKTLPSLQTQKPPPPPPQEPHFNAAVRQVSCCCPCTRANLLCVDSNVLTSQSRGHGVPNGVRVADDCSNGCANEMSKARAAEGHSDQPTENPTPGVDLRGCCSSLINAMRGLVSSILALTNALVLRLLVPQCLQRSSWSCALLVYLDPVFSLLAIIVLLATALPQVYRYGLILLQASPPKVCVSELQRRIASVAGVQGVHDLHVWQLTDMCMVASVHVHCHYDFQTHRCGDLISGVTNVLKSVGVTCCTVQPEFLPSSKTSGIIHTEQPCVSPVLACSLACGKACAGKMCCSPPKKKSCKPLAPSAGESEPQMLVIENSFL